MTTLIKKKNNKPMHKQHGIISIPASEFKAKCLTLMEEVNKMHHGIIITKFGKAVARLEPICESAQLFGCAKSSVVSKGDLFSTGEDWHAEGK